MFSRFRHAREEVQVNLIPVMNLFVTLIPFMLLSATFYHVGAIPTSFPSQTDQKSDVAVETDSVTVDVVVTQGSIEVSASNPNITEETLAELSFSLPKTDGDYDFEKFTRALFEIKRRYSKSDTVIVLPEDAIPYEQLIRVLDAARELIDNPEQATEERIPLFPVVVLSRRV